MSGSASHWQIRGRMWEMGTSQCFPSISLKRSEHKPKHRSLSETCLFYRGQREREEGGQRHRRTGRLEDRERTKLKDSETGRQEM